MFRTPQEIMETYLNEVAKNGNLDLIDELAHEDMLDEANQIFGGPKGRDGFKAHVVGFQRNITDATLEIKEIVGGNKQAMAWWQFSGHHTGPWLGINPTGQKISGTVFSFFDITEGKIARYRLWLCAYLPQKVVFDTSTGNMPQIVD